MQITSFLSIPIQLRALCLRGVTPVYSVIEANWLDRYEFRFAKFYPEMGRQYRACGTDEGRPCGATTSLTLAR